MGVEVEVSLEARELGLREDGPGRDGPPPVPRSGDHHGRPPLTPSWIWAAVAVTPPW